MLSQCIIACLALCDIRRSVGRQLMSYLTVTVPWGQLRQTHTVIQYYQQRYLVCVRHNIPTV